MGPGLTVQRLQSDTDTRADRFCEWYTQADTMNHLSQCLRTDLDGTLPTTAAETLVSLLPLSDAHVLESVSPPGCEWVERLASHHGSASLVNTLGAGLERLLAQALIEAVHRHPCVLAWLVGHRHLHRVTVHPHPGGKGAGFWEITTASIFDWPTQTRAVEILRHADGQLEIVCNLQDHQAAPDTLAGWLADLALSFAGRSALNVQGEAGMALCDC